ncbi:MAG: 2-hydroxymuconate tautomerase family protein [Alicyclobacillaceae bacterium]|nr:2-hydroxymuconate tautomerase family protein [Alicyclobacillaceae bacterium]
MIIVRVHLLRGRSIEQKHQLLRELTDHVTTTLGVDPQTVRVFIVEIDPDNWGIAGMPVSLIRGRMPLGT